MTIYGIKKTMLALLLMAGSSLPALAQEGGIDPPNPPEPTYNETYQLTLTATPDGVATVTGSGKYKEGAKVSVKTSATKTEYKFRRWERNGQSVSTSANFTYTMPAEAVTLTAVYEYDFNPSNPSEPTGEYSYHLYLQTNMADGCTFNRTSGSMAVGGKTVTVKATPATGFKFLGWYEEETLLSSNASFSYTMPEHDATLMAMVEYNPTDPAIPSGSQDGVDNDPTAVTLTANSYTREYGEDNPVFGYTVSAGSITSGTPSLSCSATKTSPVGSYPIVIKKGSVANGSVTLENGLLIITPAPLTVSAGDYTREEGFPNPEFTLTMTGFKLGETKSVLTKQPVATCDADASSPAGVYTVSVSGGEAQNYSFVYVDGTLTVTERTADVNSDGRINGMDLVASVDCILNETYNSRADLYPVGNPDGVINGMDLVELVELVMSQDGSQNAPAHQKTNK